MYSYHLWIELREAIDEVDCGNLLQKVEALRVRIRQHMNCTPLDCIHAINYSIVIQCSGSTNHRGETHDQLYGLIRYIAETLPGSFGLAYWTDDENPGAHVFNGYRVIVLARGTLTDRLDPFLSPITPTIED